MKKSFKAVQFILFLLLFAVLFYGISNIFTKKTQAQPQTIYTEEADRLDVVFVGSSHVFASIFPMMLYEQYGIASCNVASSAQTIGTSYCAIKEAIAEQHPSVIVLDMYSVYNGISYGSYADFHWFMDKVPFGMRKISLLSEMLPREEWSRYLLPFLEYHGRWKELEEKDFAMEQEEVFNKGACFTCFGAHQAFETPEILDENQRKDLPEETVVYLKKIIALCKQEDVQLLFITLPFYADGSAEFQDQRYYNEVAALAAEEDVPYVNFFHKLSELDFDFSADMAEWSHVNERGAEKLNRWLGQYLCDAYDLPDRRTDAGYEKWNRDLEIYQEKRKACLGR